MHNSTSYSIHGQLTNEVQNGVSIARTYDSLNRPTGYSLCTSASLLVSTYSANALNQYTQRTVPGYAALRGFAATNAMVTVNERPVWRINQSIGGSAAPTSARSGGNHFCLRETSCLFRDVVQE